METRPEPTDELDSAVLELHRLLIKLEREKKSTYAQPEIMALFEKYKRQNLFRHITMMNPERLAEIKAQARALEDQANGDQDETISTS